MPSAPGPNRSLRRLSRHGRGCGLGGDRVRRFDVGVGHSERNLGAAADPCLVCQRRLLRGRTSPTRGDGAASSGVGLAAWGSDDRPPCSNPDLRLNPSAFVVVAGKPGSDQPADGPKRPEFLSDHRTGQPGQFLPSSEGAVKAGIQEPAETPLRPVLCDPCRLLTLARGASDLPRGISITPKSSWGALRASLAGRIGGCP
jgi:hypothetical protein